MTDKSRLPELLAPAGGPRQLYAAIEAGADAVYFGGESFGARAYATNFTREEIADAARLCRAYGVASYVTLNTLVFDRETDEMLNYAAFLENAGIDAIIIADMGAASLIHKYIPSMRLHASTQFSGHNANAAKLLSECGFERMVAARELSYSDLKSLCRVSPIEIETFIHGALCVCHSGQCLMSSMIGGRSGNRGMCAQPCRLPNQMGKYPLSLKDLSMAARIDRLLDCGAASLKIEGRMKSPEYVYGVTKIYRRLLDERRCASTEENEELAEIFSRSGFTTGYFDKKIGSHMLGTRLSDDKEKSRELAAFEGLKRKNSIEISAVLQRGKPFGVTVFGNRGSVSAFGEIPSDAINAPLDRASVEKNLLKLGSTPYSCEKAAITMDDGLILRVSEINRVRREAVAMYDALGCRPHSILPFSSTEKKAKKTDADFCSALVMRNKNLPDCSEFFDFFDIVYLPLSEFLLCRDERVLGVALPSVITDSEISDVRLQLSSAKQKGAVFALCGNYGHLSLCTEAGLIPNGDFRLNITSQSSADFAFSKGFKRLILSPELTRAGIRDIGGDVQSFAYGRVPVMLLEKCVAKEVSDCKTCSLDSAVFTDRTGAHFPILREEPHRNIIFNSVPTYTADKPIFGGKHFLFSTESREEAVGIVNAYKKGLPPRGDIRRVKN